MSQIEKQMNKDDLHAWKKYDYNQYSMIPGISTNKKIPEPRPAKNGAPGSPDKTSIKAAR